MEKQWIKNILDKALHYADLYALLDGNGYSQRLRDVRIAGTLPEKEKIFCALLTVCEQEFKQELKKASAVAILRAKLKGIQEDIQILQEKINLEENEDKMKEFNKELDDVKQMKKALQLLELENEKLLRIKLDQQYNDFLERKRREKIEEEEKRRIAAILIEHFSNLEKSKTVYVIELEPGLQFNIEFAEIFKLQNPITDKYFKCEIDEIEYHIEKRKIVQEYVENEIDNFILLRPALDYLRLNKIKSDKIELYVDDIYYGVDSEQRAEENYSKLLEARTKLNRGHAQEIYVQERSMDNQEKNVHSQEKSIHVGERAVYTEERVMDTQVEKINAQLSQGNAQLIVDEDNIEAHHEIENVYTKRNNNEAQVVIVSTAAISPENENESQRQTEDTKSILERKKLEKKQFETQNKEDRRTSKREDRFNRFNSKNSATFFSVHGKERMLLQSPANDFQIENTPKKKAS